MRHVLVVEDDPGIGELVCEALEAGGMLAERVQSDLDAYRRIPSLPTLAGIVVDVNLGAGSSGFDVARLARQVIPPIAVFFISGDAREAAFRAHGVPDSQFVEKPFRPAELASALAHKLALDAA